MLVGEERNKVDQIWDTFWTGGLINPLLVIEQFTYLLFIKQLDDIETENEANAALLGFENDEKIFGPDQQNYRWSRFKNLAPAVQFQLMQEEIFPFIKNLHPDDEASYTRFMKDATFQISAPDKLAKIIEGIDKLDLTERDSKGDLYEYMLSKLASSKINGQFRTPRHIIKMMVEMAAPQPSDIIVDKIIAELIQAHRARNTSKPYEIRDFEVFLHCIGETCIQVMDKDGDFGGFLLRGGCRTESAPFVRCRYLSKHRLQGV